MSDITLTGESSVDIWPYVEILVESGAAHPLVFENNLVEKVFRNDRGDYDHVLLPTPETNIFLVIVVSIREKAVYGHYRLNMSDQYKI